MVNDVAMRPAATCRRSYRVPAGGAMAEGDGGRGVERRWGSAEVREYGVREYGSTGVRVVREYGVRKCGVREGGARKYGSTEVKQEA